MPTALTVDLPRRLPEETEACAYFVVAEAVTNIAKHANATQVSVLLQKRGDSITLIIEDDGIGFDRKDDLGDSISPHGLGLIGMQERAALMKGTLEIESLPGEGTTVLARIPYA